MPSSAVILRVSLLGFFFLGFSSFSVAQHDGSEEYSIRRIGVRDGLANQVITAICEPPDGKLWFSTLNGLYSFDGFRATRIPNPHHPSLKIGELVLDIESISLRSGDYLVLCYDSNSQLFDLSTHQRVPFSKIGLPDDLLSECRSIEKSSDGQYVLLCGNTLYQIAQTGEQSLSLSEPLGKVQYIKPPKILSPRDAEGAVWISSSKNEVLRVRHGQNKTFVLPEIANNPPSYPGLLGLLRTESGLVGWDNARNLYRFNVQRERFDFIKPDEINFYELFPAFAQFDQLVNQRNMLHCIAHLSAGQTALGTSLGIFVSKKFERSFHLPAATVGNEIRGIAADANGNWWASTYYNTISGNMNSQHVTLNNQISSVWAFLPITDDIWMLGCENRRGIAAWNPNTNELLPINSTSPGKPLSSVLSLCKDQSGYIWAGSYSNIFWASPNAPFDFHPLFAETPHTARPNWFVRALMSDKNDSTLWIGSDKGVFLLQYKNSPENYQLDTLFNHVSVSDFYQDTFGQVWIATKGAGLARYRPQTKRLDWFTTEAGLSNDFTCRIESSNHDSVLWVSTHDGLSRFDVHSGTFHHYREHDGMPGNEFNSAASARAPDGTLLFGGISGLVYFQPNALNPGNYRYKTIISHVHLYPEKDSSVSVMPSDGILQLPPYLKVFEICIGLNDFVHADRATFRYRLLGASDKWISVKGDSKLRFFQLSPGKYTLQVQALPDDGHYGPIASLEILVSTPYYESWWFRLLLLLAIIGISYCAYLYRVRQLLAMQAVRQQIADDLHDDIGNKLNINHILLQKIKHEYLHHNAPLPTQLWDKILEANQNTLQALRTLIWSVDPKKDRLSNLIARMQDFADDYLTPLNIRCRLDLPDLQPEKELKLDVRHHIIMIYQEMLTNMVKHAPPANIQVKMELDNGGNLTLTLLNTLAINESLLVSSDSGLQGTKSILRRLQKINGKTLLTESTPRIQKTVLLFPQIFR